MDLLDGIFNGGLYFWVLWIVVVVYISVEICWVDKYIIYFVDIEDLWQIFQCFVSFNLYQYVYGVIGLVDIIWDVILV